MLSEAADDPDTESVLKNRGLFFLSAEDVQLAVESMKLGAYDYLCKPIDDVRLLIILERALQRWQMRGELSKLRDQVSLEGLRHKEVFKSIITQSKSFLRVLQRVDQIAESDNYVLFWEESGAFFGLGFLVRRSSKPS